jgi:hypothetical protein
VEYDIIVNGKQLTGSAKWEEILKVYDDRCIVYCLLLKVTERHIKPYTQSATKVSLSAPMLKKCSKIKVLKSLFTVVFSYATYETGVTLPETLSGS